MRSSINEGRSFGYESIRGEDEKSPSPPLDESFYVTFEESKPFGKEEKYSKVGAAALGAIAFAGMTFAEVLFIPRALSSVPPSAILAAGAICNGLLIGTIEYLVFKALAKKDSSSALSYSDGVYTIRGQFDDSSIKLSRGVEGQWARDGYRIRFADSNREIKSLEEFEKELKDKGLLPYKDLLEVLSTQGPIDAEMMQVANLIREQKNSSFVTEFFSAIFSDSQKDLHTEPVFIIHDPKTETTKIHTKMERKKEGLEGEMELLGTYQITFIVEWRSLKKLLTIAPFFHASHDFEEIAIQ